QGAGPGARLHRRRAGGGRVRPLDSERARLPGGGAERRDLPAQLFGPDRRQDPAGLLDLYAAARARARAARRNSAGRSRLRRAELGVRFPREREEEFADELRDVYYRYYGVSLAEIDPLQVIREAFDVIYRMNLRLPTRFVLLDKAIATLASVGIELYPDFNVFEVAKPYARNLMVERFSPERILARAQKESREFVRIGATLPYQVHDFLEQIRDGQIEVGFVHKGLDEFMHKVDVAFNRLVVALIVVGGLIGSSLIGIFAKHGPFVFGVN